MILRRSLVTACTVALHFALPAQNAAVSPATKGTLQVAPGVMWFNQVVPSGPLNYNVLKVEVEHPQITLETESGKELLGVGEKVLDSVVREADPPTTEIIGGVNGDFWSNSPGMYSPVGLLVADGMIYNMPAKQRRAFVFTKDETPYIGRISLQVSIESGKKKLLIDRINGGFGSKNQVLLFTPPYQAVPPAEGSRYLLKMEGPEFLPNQLLEVQMSKVDASTTTVVDAETLVLHVPSAKQAAAIRLQDGSKVTLSAVMPEVEGVVTSVCGGGPALVQQGQPRVATDEGTGTSFSLTRHPRTAVGYSKDRKTIYLVTVDGRQPKVSAGVGLEELAQYMSQLGCWEAINLDGGGSTTMVVNGKVVNRPSDLRGPRTVANSLLVVLTTGTLVSEHGGKGSGATLVVPASRY